MAGEVYDVPNFDDRRRGTTRHVERYLESRRAAGDAVARLNVRGARSCEHALRACQRHAAQHGPVRVHDREGFTRAVERMTKPTDGDLGVPMLTTTLEIVFGPTTMRLVGDPGAIGTDGNMPDVMPASGELVIDEGDGRVYFYGAGAVIVATSAP